jgi:hypothetical protein
MLDVPDFIAPMMIRLGSATGSRLLPFRQDLRAWHPAELADDHPVAVGRPDAAGWNVVPRQGVMKPDERACT